MFVAISFAVNLTASPMLIYEPTGTFNVLLISGHTDLECRLADVFCLLVPSVESPRFGTPI